MAWLTATFLLARTVCALKLLFSTLQWCKHKNFAGQGLATGVVTWRCLPTPVRCERSTLTIALQLRFLDELLTIRPWA